MLHLSEQGLQRHGEDEAVMPGGRRKSRKPQKWEDFVADEEQLASLEQELEQEEVARMKLEGPDDSDGELNLEIVMEDEDNNIKVEEEEVDGDADVVEAAQGENGEEDPVKVMVVEMAVPDGEKERVKTEDEKEESPSTTHIGDCTTCGIQLRDWPSTHSHLCFHRLSHVPDCISKATIQSKRINCQVCQRTCQTQEVLAYHAYTEHYVKMRQAKTCPFCCSVFSCLDEFLDHLDITDVSFNCEMCGITVTQEHKFYQHIVYCCKKHLQGLTGVPCCVCGTDTKINRLYDHLTQHSTQLNLPCHLASTTKTSNKRIAEPCTPKLQTRFRPFLCEMCDRRFVVYSEYKRHLHSHTKSRAYVCTHCGRSYCQKNTLIVHLYSYHNASPNSEEVTPKGEATQRQWRSRRCEACDRVGFVNEELLVRHCIMRCPRRNNLQASFAVIIASIAKNQNTSFAETLCSPAMVTYLKLGLEAWQTPAFVRNYLEKLQNAASSNTFNNLTIATDLTTAIAAHTSANTLNTSNRKDSAEFTDIQLLAYLTQFEEKNRADKERDTTRTTKTKSDGQWVESQVEEEMEEGGGDESLLPFLCTTTSTPSSPPATSCSPPLSYPTTAPQINHASLMQHLRRGSERRSGAEYTQGGGQGEGVSPVDICLVTSTTNTQVTITPAGHHLTQDIKPPKIAKSLPHKPSVAEIKAQYPGVTVLGDVDFSRVPYLLMEMRECMSDRHERAMEAAGITLQDIQRLEVEAQFLREAEPFYLEEYPVKENKDDKNCLTSLPSPTLLQRLDAEIEEMYEGSRKDNDMQSSPSSPDSLLKTKDENGHDVDVSQGNNDSPPHSPSRKRLKMGTDTNPASPEKCGGGNGSVQPSAAQESFPPKQLLDRLLREAQMLSEG